MDFIIRDGVLEKYVGTEPHVTVPDGVRTVGEMAFRGREIESVTLPATLTRIADGAFHFIESLRRVTFSGDGVREIPPVCFCNCRALETVMLPDGLRRIGKEAFSRCMSLRHLSFPATLEEIGARAFYRCEGLEEAMLPDGLLRIGDDAFLACESLKRTRLPASLIGVGRRAFGEIPALTPPVLPADWKYVQQLPSRESFERETLWCVLLSDAKASRRVAKFLKREAKKILAYSVEKNDATLALSLLRVWKRVPLEMLEAMQESVKSSPEHLCALIEYRHRQYTAKEMEAFLTRRFTLEEEPDENSWAWLARYFRFSVKGEEIALKEYLGEASEIFLPTSVGGKRVTRVLPSLFRLSFGRMSFAVAEDNPCFMTRKGSLFSRDGRVLYAYFDTGETEIAIPEGVCEIGACAFWGVGSVSAVTIPASVTLVGSEAFRGCQGLKRVAVLGEGVEIGAYAFSECTSLTEASIPAVRVIGFRAFAGCESLLHVSVFRTLERVENAAFLGCKSLESLKLPDSVSDLGDFVCGGCAALTTVRLPRRLRSLGKMAFARCSSLRAVYLPTTLRVLRENTFYQCVALKNVTVPRGLEIIEERAFHSCGALEELSLPATLASIGDDAFRGTVIRSLCFAGHAVSFDGEALGGCLQTLREIYWNGSLSSWRYAYSKNNCWGTRATVYCRDGILHDRPVPTGVRVERYAERRGSAEEEELPWWEKYDEKDL